MFRVLSLSTFSDSLECDSESKCIYVWTFHSKRTFDYISKIWNSWICNKMMDEMQMFASLRELLIYVKFMNKHQKQNCCNWTKISHRWHLLTCFRFSSTVMVHATAQKQLIFSFLKFLFAWILLVYNLEKYQEHII